jgi:ABC-2 type transport system ATP-binding protein
MIELEVSNLKKSFRSNLLLKNIEVLKNVNIKVRKGSIYGFLGPNGAGKTTTIKSILGLVIPDSGVIKFEGIEIGSYKIREKLGFLPENPYYYDYLTGREMLLFSGKIFSIEKKELNKRIDDIIEMVGLSGKGNIKLKNYSKGMLQRIGLGQALVNDPSLLILDEPFSGLDPVGRKQLRDIILSLKERGKTVFFSSHILQDMELIVDDIGILINGEISREGKLDELAHIFSESKPGIALEDLFMNEMRKDKK